MASSTSHYVINDEEVEMNVRRNFLYSLGSHPLLPPLARYMLTADVNTLSINTAARRHYNSTVEITLVFFSFGWISPKRPHAKLIPTMRTVNKTSA